MTSTTTQKDPGGLLHSLLLYDCDAQFSAAVADFAHEGLAAGEPVLVAAPGARLDSLRAALNESGDAVAFVDARGVGANPARLIPAYRQFIDDHPARRLRLTGELMWPGRTAGEVAEITRHEALVNLAFDGVPVSVQCLYDSRALGRAALADIERAHPVLIRGGGRHANAGYACRACPRSATSRCPRRWPTQSAAASTRWAICPPCAVTSPTARRASGCQARASPIS